MALPLVLAHTVEETETELQGEEAAQRVGDMLSVGAATVAVPQPEELIVPRPPLVAVAGWGEEVAVVALVGYADSVPPLRPSSPAAEALAGPGVDVALKCGERVALSDRAPLLEEEGEPVSLALRGGEPLADGEELRLAGAVGSGQVLGETELLREGSGVGLSVPARVREAQGVGREVEQADGVPPPPPELLALLLLRVDAEDSAVPLLLAVMHPLPLAASARLRVPTLLALPEPVPLPESLPPPLLPLRVELALLHGPPLPVPTTEPVLELLKSAEEEPPAPPLLGVPVPRELPLAAALPL